LVDETTRIRAGLIAEGPSAIVAAQKRMRDERAGLDSEFRRIRAQESLDSVEVDPEHERAFFDALQEADTEAEESGESEFNAWVIDRLQFGRREEYEGGFRYVHCGASSRRPTLVPLFDAVARFGLSIDRQANTRSSRNELPFRPVTFERTTAEQEGIELLRVGHQFFEGMEALIRADDRGAAFAMWRHVPKWRHDPRLFFRFDFVVEADLSFAREAIRTHHASGDALRRRAERSFPADHVTVWIDSDMEEVRDDETRRLLELPYVNKKTRSDGGLDLSLRLERWTAADQLAPTSDWSALCLRARSAAEALLRRGSGFQEKCAACARRSLEVANRVGNTLRARIARLDGPVRDAEERALEFDTQLAHALARGIEAPTVRVDSVGAIYLAAVPLRVE
jgi:ATP-dependent helicase HepA